MCTRRGFDVTDDGIMHILNASDTNDDGKDLVRLNKFHFELNNESLKVSSIL